MVNDIPIQPSSKDFNELLRRIITNRLAVVTEFKDNDIKVMSLEIAHQFVKDHIDDIKESTLNEREILLLEEVKNIENFDSYYSPQGGKFSSPETVGFQQYFEQSSHIKAHKGLEEQMPNFFETLCVGYEKLQSALKVQINARAKEINPKAKGYLSKVIERIQKAIDYQEAKTNSKHQDKRTERISHLKQLKTTIEGIKENINKGYTQYTSNPDLERLESNVLSKARATVGNHRRGSKDIKSMLADIENFKPDDEPQQENSFSNN